MNFRPTEITLIDPREFDGDPYQVAERAVNQIAAALARVNALVDPTAIMVRNAELERQMALGTNADDLREQAQGFPESPQGRKVFEVTEKLDEIITSLGTLARAAKYDPKNPGGTGKRAPKR